MKTPDSPSISIEMVSDHACLITFSHIISETTADQIRVVTKALRGLSGIVDLIPSYTTLLVVFDTDHFDRFAICSKIRQCVEQQNFSNIQSEAARVITIPVYYGNEVGPDLADVAEHCQMSIDEVIQQHSQTRYRAYAIGFSPGFAFLGNTPEALHVPRKDTPRLKVPVGSVAIAERQTAVYPSATPGGWQVIGRTPIPLIDWDSESLALIEVGDTVLFEAITREEFLAQGGQLNGF